MAQKSEDIERGRFAGQQQAEERLSYSTFDQRLARVSVSDLFYERAGDTVKGDYNVNLGNLQRMILHGLQKELVDEIAGIKTKEAVGKIQRDRINILHRNYGECG